MTKYSRFTDDLLVALYYVSRESGEPQFFVARAAFDRLEDQRSEHDRWEALNDLDRQGYINALSEIGINSYGRNVMILGPGIARAEEIINTRKPKTLIQKLSNVPRSDWIALGALIISLVALFK